MKKTILILSLLVLIIGTNAQEIQQTSGKLGFLKNQTQLSISFKQADGLITDRYNQVEFIKLINKVLNKEEVFVSENNEKAVYEMQVITTSIETDSKNAYVNLRVVFVDINNPNYELATFAIDKSPATLSSDTESNTTKNIAEAYAVAGKKFILFLLKKTETRN